MRLVHFSTTKNRHLHWLLLCFALYKIYRHLSRNFEVFIITATDDFAFKFGSRLGLYTSGGGTTVGNQNININYNSPWYKQKHNT